MIHLITLEALYPEMEEATIGRWIVHEDAEVDEGAPLAELITDKVAYEYQSPSAGKIIAVLAAEKSVVPVGTTLAVVGDADDTIDNLPELLAENQRLAAERETAIASVIQVTTTQETPTAAQGGQGVRATPAARRLARERGVDLATLTGTGPGGIITVEDIPSGEM